MAGIYKNLDASDIRLTPFRAYKQYEGISSYTTYSAILNVNVPDGQEDLGNTAYYNAEYVNLTTNSASANSVWHSINSQFYKYYYANPKASFGQLNHTRQPRYLSNKAIVVSVPQRYSGEGIAPTTFAMTVNGTTYEDDLYGNIVTTSGRWGSGGEISASNVVFTLKPSTYTDQFGKVLNYTEPSCTDLYQASIKLTNAAVTASQYETVLSIDSTAYNTSSITIIPNGTDVNQLFNFQNKDYTIILTVGSFGGTGVLLEKRQLVEVTKLDFDGNIGTQKIYRYPYSLRVNSSKKVVFTKSDGRTTLTQQTSWNLNGDYPLILKRNGTSFTLLNNTNTTTFTDTLYNQERYCVNNANIQIGADENGENAISGLVGNVSFLNYAPPNDAFTPITAGESFNNPYVTVGNIFRQHGMVVITDKSLISEIEANGISALEYRGTTTIYENEISCTVGAGEFGMTFNPTAHEYDPTIDEYKMASFATGSDFRPFVTRIGLYSDRSELVAIGTLSQPIQLPKNVDTTFILRYDV